MFFYDKYKKYTKKIIFQFGGNKIKLNILKKNKYGDILYIENHKNHNTYDSYDSYDLPDDIGIWIIKSPSNELKKYYSNYENRVYNNIEYLLSSAASKIISKNTNSYGSCGIISFLHKNTRYFIMTIDDKNYVQNPQGGQNEGETPIECIKRELFEELNINIYDKQCKEVGFWSFNRKNELIDIIFNHKTTLYYINVSFEQIKHLITRELLNMNIINVADYNFKLDETLYVIISSFENIMSHDKNIKITKKDKLLFYPWDGHHRQAILSLYGVEKYKTSYLKDFFVKKIDL
jgi:hypothetical protein